MVRKSYSLATWITLATVFSLSSSPARALVVGLGDGPANTIAPLDDPGWNNVGAVNGSSAVYLGNRWVLTANHVGAGDMKFATGTFHSINGSQVQVPNPTGFGLSTNTDLLMFRLDSDPGLPTLQIGSNQPPLLSQVTYVGIGASRSGPEVAWVRQSVGSDVVWNQTSLGGTNAEGFIATGPQVKTWGLGVVENAASINSGNGTDSVVLSTSFMSNLPLAAQVEPGDSGGAVFSRGPSGWQLSGIINSLVALQGQPGNTAVFGDTSQASNLAFYKGGIEKIMTDATPVQSAWQNALNPLDVNKDGIVSALDALLVINELTLRGGAVSLPPNPDHVTAFVDVDGDRLLSSHDALLVINGLNARNQAPVTNAIAVPEPSSWALSALALLGTLLLGRGRFRRAR